MRCCYLSSTLRLPDASTHPVRSCSLGTDPSPPARTLAPQWSYWMQGRRRHSMTCRRMRSLLGGCRGRGRSSSSRASCHKCTVVSGTLGRGFACDGILSDRRMEFNGQIRSEWTNVAHLKKRFEAPYEAARATRPPNTPNPTKNRPQDTHNTLTEQENSARASSADQLSIRWAIRPKRQNRRLRTLRSPNSRPERAPARAWCGRRRACRPGRWGRS